MAGIKEIDAPTPVPMSIRSFGTGRTGAWIIIKHITIAETTNLSEQQHTLVILSEGKNLILTVESETINIEMLHCVQHDDCTAFSTSIVPHKKILFS